MGGNVPKDTFGAGKDIYDDDKKVVLPQTEEIKDHEGDALINSDVDEDDMVNIDAGDEEKPKPAAEEAKIQIVEKIVEVVKPAPPMHERSTQTDVVIEEPAEPIQTKVETKVIERVIERFIDQEEDKIDDTEIDRDENGLYKIFTSSESAEEPHHQPKQDSLSSQFLLRTKGRQI